MDITENYSLSILLCLVYLDLGPTYWKYDSQDSAVSIVTCYQLDILEIECWWSRDFQCLSRLVPRYTQPFVQWVLVLSWG
jgi:hypothetical protein